MSQIININSPGKERNKHRRTVAEILRRLSQKPSIDSEAQDMAAAMVFLLRDIYGSADQTAKAWEKKGYWMKADRLLREWQWTVEAAANLEDVIRNDAWDLLPRLLGEMVPYTADVRIKTLTRPASTWQGAHAKLLAEPPGDQPW